MGKAGGVWEKPMVQRVSAWIGICSFLVGMYWVPYIFLRSLIGSTLSGLASFLIIRMYFGKAVSDFNMSIQGQGSNGPQLIANTGNAFTSESPRSRINLND